MFGEDLFELFFSAGIWKVSDEQSAWICNILLFFIFFQIPSEVPANLFVPFVFPGFTSRVVHAKDLNVPPTWNTMFTGLCKKSWVITYVYSSYNHIQKNKYA